MMPFNTCIVWLGYKYTNVDNMDLCALVSQRQSFFVFIIPFWADKNSFYVYLSDGYLYN